MDVTQPESEPRSPGRSLGRFIPKLSQGDWASVLAIQLLVVTLLVRLLWLNQPQGLIFDETYYVNAARVILGWPVPEGAPYGDAQPFRDPNAEHLPLAKLMIAASMFRFGDNGLGWRLPSVLFGTAAVGLLYLLVRRLTRRSWLALFAAFVFSFDNLVLVHGRIATLDIFMLAFLLLGLYCYVAGRPWLAGVSLALSTLSKFNGVYGLAAIAILEVLRLALRSDRRALILRSAAEMLVLVGSFTVVFLAVLWPLDSRWTSYTNPLDHVAHVYTYGMSLTRSDGPQGIESTPLQWLLNEVPIPYFRQNTNVIVDGKVISSRSTIDFVGEMNPFVIAMLPLTLAYLFHAAWRSREDLPILMLALFAATYLPPFATAVFIHRISYLFYFLPVLPALCTGIAYFLLDSRLPCIVPIGYTVGLLLGFVAMFPFRTLPT